MRMKCTTPHVYAGQPRRIGELFEVEDKHVRLWQALGRAVPDDQQYRTTQVRRTRKNRMMQAATE